jgi:hypothetical protein
MTGTSEADRVALMQRAWDAYNAGEVDAVIELLDPEVEVSLTPPEGSRVCGPAMPQ